MSTATETPPRIAEALRLHREGFEVIPLRPGDKRPIGEEWPTRPSLDEQGIRGHRGNFGIRTTRYRDRALIVVDVDNKTAERRGSTSVELLELMGMDLPATRTHGSPTGGLHYIYTAPAPLNGGAASALASGIDVLSNGKQIVAPGSTVPAGEYTVLDARDPEPAPQWLLDWCRTTRCSIGRKLAPAVSANVPADFERAIEYLEQRAPTAVEGKGGDTATLEACHGVIDFIVGEQDALDLLLDHWNDEQSPPWKPDDLAQKVRNAFAYRQTAPGSALARAEFSAVELEPGDEAAPPAKRPRFVVEDFAAIKARTGVASLVKGLLDAGAMSLVYGESNTGKTFLALDLALHVATGREWHGRRVQRGAVVYLAAEGGLGVRRRVEAFRKYHGMEGTRVPFGMIGSAADLCSNDRDAALLAEAVTDFAAAHGEVPVLLVVDTLARSLGGGDENSGRDMGAFVQACDLLRARTGAHVLAVHHAGKDTSKGARGHSSLRAAIDTEIEVADRQARPTKQRDRELGQPIGFELVPVDLGVDADGVPVTSCIVRPRSLSAARDFQPTEPKRGSQAATMLATLRAMSAHAAVEGAPPADPFEPGAPVLEADWRNACLGELSARPDTAARIYRRGRDELIKLNCIVAEGDFIRPR